VRWATTAVLGAFGYVTYVAALVLGRLSEQYSLALATKLGDTAASTASV
jgi:hypothetical protein